MEHSYQVTDLFCLQRMPTSVVTTIALTRLCSKGYVVSYKFDSSTANDSQFVDFSKRYGGGKYNLTVAGEYRYKRIQDSIATNPTFNFIAPRIFSAYSEAVNPINLWVDGRQDDGQLDTEVARSFFQKMRFPDDFHRAARPMNGENELDVLAAHPIEPGTNVNGVNTYTPDPTSGTLPDKCTLYENHVNRTVRSLYPNPTGNLLVALKANMHYFYTSVQPKGCKEIFPYGRWNWATVDQGLYMDTDDWMDKTLFFRVVGICI